MPSEAFKSRRICLIVKDSLNKAGIHQKPPVLLRAVRIFTVGQFPVDQKFCVTDLKLCLSHNSPVSFLVLLLLVFCCFVMLEYLYFYLSYVGCITYYVLILASHYTKVNTT